MDQTNKDVCACPHHRVIPFLVLIAGVVFLLEAFSILSVETVSYIWPILLIIAAGSKLFEHKCTCC